ncbi:DUF3566 domain-containing protein [Gulosibacter bifidus]|uniref:DUF3566 domain-containing protein n=1 Tax=Gulosibacter bifidus TaxID=272239 RepID=A0ABW5RKN2_9MICO|nr:DUF3566 domain-containing protein [Gulosibacter bifidus]
MTSVADKLAQKTERRTRGKQVRLRLVQVDVWSVVKMAFWIALFCGLATIVAFILGWVVLANTGVLDSINALLNDVTGGGENKKNSVSVEQFINFGSVALFGAVCGVLQIIVYTALAAVGAFVYNLLVRVTGGLVFGFTNN